MNEIQRIGGYARNLAYSLAFAAAFASLSTQGSQQAFAAPEREKKSIDRLVYHMWNVKPLATNRTDIQNRIEATENLVDSLLAAKGEQKEELVRKWYKALHDGAQDIHLPGR